MDRLNALLNAARERAIREGRMGSNGAVYRTAESRNYHERLKAWKAAGSPVEGTRKLMVERDHLLGTGKL